MLKITRKLLLAATLALLVHPEGVAALAEDAAAQPAGDMFSRLEQLQDANLGIARQMSEIEQRAAAQLEAAIEDGSIADPAHQSIARTFIANARTLASVMLSPIQTRQTAAGDSMMTLIQRNIAMLQSIAPYAAQNRNLSAAIARYSVLQMQTEDLASALQNGWRRYGDILREAESAGLLTANAFNPGTQSWSLDTPVIGPSQVAALPEPVEPAAPQSTTEPEPAPPVEPATATPSPAIPEPQLSGQPKPAAEAALADTVAPLAVPPLADAPPAADIPERLAPGEPLDVAAPTPQSTAIGDWTFSVDESGNASVTSRNLNADTSSVIQALTIKCGPDGNLQFVVDATQQFYGFRIYADRSAYRTVAAERNAVTGSDAVIVSDTLKLGGEWARQVPDAGRRLTVRATDGEGTLALFAVSGYLEGRDRVVAACALQKRAAVAAAKAASPAAAPADSSTITGAVPTQPPDEPEAAEPQAAEPAPAEPVAETTPPPRQPPRETKAPIPAPRLERPVEAPGPIDIMNGG